MAQDLIFTAAITPNVKAVADLRNFQHHLVVFDDSAVRLATTVTSGPVWVLINKPNSGEACSLLGPPNVCKVYASQAVKRNQPVTVSPTQSGWCAPTSVGVASNLLTSFGVAMTAVASGSLVDVYFRG